LVHWCGERGHESADPDARVAARGRGSCVEVSHEYPAVVRIELNVGHN